MVAVTGSQLRASDAERDRAVEALKRGLVEGRLSYETFVSRVEVALRARESAVLVDALAGLPGRGLRERLRRRVADKKATKERRGVTPHATPLPLPDRSQPTLLVGRSRICDLVLSDAAVSRRHASLMLFGANWFVIDHGSTNGTWVNGRPVSGETVVRAGDRLRVGEALFRLAPPAKAAAEHA